MNPDTRVSVHCYAGDVHQVQDALHLYLHHHCPITIISPEDSQGVVRNSAVENVFAGQRTGSVITRNVDGRDRIITAGVVANDRQIAQMRRLLEYPESFFFMNDADSFCLAPELPAYLYAEPDTVWCNLVDDPLPENQPGYVGYPEDFPHAALQPPYFVHRRSIEAMLAVYDSIAPNPVMPWIDHLMLQMAYAAKLTYKAFPDRVASDLDRYEANLPRAVNAVRYEGKIFIHSSKSPLSWAPLVEARNQYLADPEIQK